MALARAISAALAMAAVAACSSSDDVASTRGDIDAGRSAGGSAAGGGSAVADGAAGRVPNGQGGTDAGGTTGQGVDASRDVTAPDAALADAATDSPEPPALEGGSGDAASCNSTPGTYDSCVAATNQTDCETNGGAWGPIGLFPGDECQCPTEQSACPCSSSDDCLSACIALLDSSGCGAVTTGTCSPVSITLGCHCWIDTSGTATALCAD